MIICLGPVCVPIYALLPFLAAVFYKVKEAILAWWGGDAAAAAASGASGNCEGGVCTLNGTAPDAHEGGLSGTRSELEWPFSTSKVAEVESEERWQELVRLSQQGRTLVVKFTATWCKPCHAIQPHFEGLAKDCNPKGNEVAFVTVDTDELDDVAAECSVSAMPTFLVFKSGNKVAEVLGAREQALTDIIRLHCK